MSPPLVSIVIPSYNCAPYILETIQSAADQTYRNKELIVVDDCSSDGSDGTIQEHKEEIASRFSGGFTFLRNKTNHGAHYTLNCGARESRGDYIFFLNADDLYEPNRLQVMIQPLQAGADMAFSSVRCIDGAGQKSSLPLAQKFESLPSRIQEYPFSAAAAAAENICVSSGNLAVRKTFFQLLQGFRPFLYVHDYDFFVRGCLLSEPVFVPDTAYRYRLHSSNSFLRLSGVGKKENRLVWMETFAAIKTGNIKNSRILAEPDYASEFYAALQAYGRKKELLYRIAASPLGNCFTAALQRSVFQRVNRPKVQT